MALPWTIASSDGIKKPWRAEISDTTAMNQAAARPGPPRRARRPSMSSPASEAAAPRRFAGRSRRDGLGAPGSGSLLREEAELLRGLEPKMA
mmetsp:Transcript_96469/g.281952  ORF Transcript_96469/g.281952 Transcript_96469/m.281952 type:complete len:92 (+) Transcript_96469:549-824(+)